MKEAQITFYKCIQDSQEFGSDNEHMISRVFFTIDIDGKKTDLYTNIKQTVQSKFLEKELEVSFLEGLKGPFNYEEFSKLVRKYFLSLVGPEGKYIKFGNGCANIRMQHNIFIEIFVTKIKIN